MEYVWLLLLLPVMPLLDVLVFVPSTNGWYLLIRQYYAYLVIRSMFAVVSWFALGVTEFPAPIVKVLAAAVGGVTILQNTSLKSLGVPLSFGEQLDNWRENLLAKAGALGRTKEFQARIALIDTLSTKPINDVLAQAGNMVAAMDNDEDK